MQAETTCRLHAGREDLAQTDAAAAAHDGRVGGRSGAQTGLSGFTPSYAAVVLRDADSPTGLPELY
ncbi:hypothetical protein AB0D98_11375 [Streptomyces sp. NPDC047987]|uniref:hypothetical protein n=1 Tax=Streptomyces sp. NPDC047987 TaxID=3154925 RepID=UPI0034485768